MPSKMIDKITYRQLQRLTVKELEDLLRVNGGIILITVDSQSKFCVNLLPLPTLTVNPGGLIPSSNRGADKHLPLASAKEVLVELG